MGLEEDELIAELAWGRMTPRLNFLCCMCITFPIDSVFVHFDDGQRLSSMDIAAMEKEEFSNPTAAGLVKEMAMQTDICKPVALRVSPATSKLPAKVSAKLSDGMKLNVRSSMFDVVSPQTSKKGGSKSAEKDAMTLAVESVVSRACEGLFEGGGGRGPFCAACLFCLLACEPPPARLFDALLIHILFHASLSVRHA